MKTKHNGFTIVELLVVVVIGILATISVIAYSGIQNRAYDTKLTATSKQIESKIQEHTIFSGGGIAIDAGALDDKQSVLEQFELQTLDESIDYYTEEIPAHQYDRKKVFVRAYPTELNWSYWSNEKEMWIVHRAFGSGEVARWESGHPDPWAGM